MNDRQLLLLLLLLGGAAYYYFVDQNQSAGDLESDLESAGDTVQGAIEGWANVEDGPTWVPVINQTESALGIPPNLLARMAYQESHFRPDIIDGTTPSPAGALGILQLMPQYFDSVNVTRPYTTADTQAQITEAGNFLMSLYQQFNNWEDAIAAYNAGATTVSNSLSTGAALPQETQNYVSQILADVSVPQSA